MAYDPQGPAGNDGVKNGKELKHEHNGICGNFFPPKPEKIIAMGKEKPYGKEKKRKNVDKERNQKIEKRRYGDHRDNRRGTEGHGEAAFSVLYGAFPTLFCCTGAPGAGYLCDYKSGSPHDCNDREQVKQYGKGDQESSPCSANSILCVILTHSALFLWYTTLEVFPLLLDCEEL